MKNHEQAKWIFGGIGLVIGVIATMLVSNIAHSSSGASVGASVQGYLNFSLKKPVVVSPSWGWKLATTSDDALNFMNGKGSYTTPHAIGGIAGTEKGFYIFYRNDLKGTSDWGWKLAPTSDDALSFLNGKGSYTGPAKGQALFAEKNDGFYIFYRGTSPLSTWAWKKSTDINDMNNFINGNKPYNKAQNGTIAGLSTSFITIFYRNDSTGTSGWGWKLASGIDDANNFLNGAGTYSTPVKDARIFATGTNFYIFYRK